MSALDQFNARVLYDVYRCTIAFRDKVCGGTPKNKELLETFVKVKTGFDDEKTKEQVKEITEAMVDDVVEKSWNGFPSDERGLFLWSRQVKALFKECATMLRVTTTKIGSKQIFQHGFEIKGPDVADRLYLGVDKPTAYDEGPIHVQTPQGPRTAIKRVDYVLKPRLSFEVWVLRTAAAEKRHVGEDELVQMLTFGQENGIGADRSQGHGKFDVVEWSKAK